MTITTTYTASPAPRVRLTASWLEMSTTGVVADITACTKPNFHGDAQRTTPGHLGEVT